MVLASANKHQDDEDQDWPHLTNKDWPYALFFPFSSSFCHWITDNHWSIDPLLILSTETKRERESVCKY